MLADTRHSGLLFLGVWFRPPVGGCRFGVACLVAFGVYVCLLSWSCCWPVSLCTDPFLGDEHQWLVQRSSVSCPGLRRDQTP